MKLVIGKKAITISFEAPREMDAFLTQYAASLRTPEQVSADYSKQYGEPSESLEQG